MKDNNILWRSRTSRFLYATLLTLSASSLFTPVAAKAEREPFRMEWTVAGSLDNPSGAGRIVRLKSGEVFLRHRLLPNKAAKLTNDLLDPKGATLLSKGTELFGVETSGLIIFCNAEQQGTSAMRSLLVASSFSHVCLIDRDADGKFESNFKARGVIKGLPSLDGRVPKKVGTNVPVGFEAMDPASMAIRYFVGVEYEGKPLLYNRRNFRITFGNEKKQQSLSDWSYVSGASYPQSLNQLGGRFTLLSEADGLLTLRVDNEIPPQPFGVRMTVQFR